MDAEPLTETDLTDLVARWDARKPHTAEYWEGKPCGACGAAVGAYHEDGCDHEHCPHCGDQTLSCGNCQGETAATAFPRLLATINSLTRERDALRSAGDDLFDRCTGEEMHGYDAIGVWRALRAQRV